MWIDQLFVEFCDKVWQYIKWPYAIALFGSAFLILLNWPLDFMSEWWYYTLSKTFVCLVLLGWTYMILFGVKIKKRHE